MFSDQQVAPIDQLKPHISSVWIHFFLLSLQVLVKGWMWWDLRTAPGTNTASTVRDVRSTFLRKASSSKEETSSAPNAATRSDGQPNCCFYYVSQNPYIFYTFKRAFILITVCVSACIDHTKATVTLRTERTSCCLLWCCMITFLAHTVLNVVVTGFKNIHLTQNAQLLVFNPAFMWKLN